MLEKRCNECHHADKTGGGADAPLEDSLRLGAMILKSDFRPDFIVGVWRGGTPVGIAVQELLEHHGGGNLVDAVAQLGASMLESIQEKLTNLEAEQSSLRRKLDELTKSAEPGKE